MTKFYVSLFLVFCTLISNGQNSIFEKLQQIPEISDITEIPSTEFDKYYQFYYKQPIDHEQPNEKFFYQRVELGFRSFEAPTVVNLEGYSLRSPAESELAKSLKSNQISIEHRYFGESVSYDKIQWKYLTIKQSATDQHRIIQTLKTILTNNRWITYGISKGGQCVTFHRYFFPDDVKAGVAYVAPINQTMIDPRIDKYLNKIGESEKFKNYFLGKEDNDLNTKWNILDFQLTCFKRKAEILPLMEIYAHQHNLTFNSVGGVEHAYNLSVLEYQFSFWQWGHSHSEIPNIDGTAEEIFNSLIQVSSPDFFSDKDIRYYQPFFYAALTETGLYEYNIKPFKKYLGNKKNISFNFAFPQNTERSAFNQTQMDSIQLWLKTDAKNLLFIYGSNDPWSATAADLGNNINCYKFIRHDKSHKCRIADFEGALQMTMYEILKDWLKQ